jgi:hypothetical protein
LIRDRFAASIRAFRTRSNRLIRIRNGVKSSHLERVKMIGSSQGILCLLLAAQLDCKRMTETGESKGSYKLLARFSHRPRRTGIRPATCRIPLPCHALPSSDAISVKNASASMLPLSRRGPLQLQGLETVDPTLSYWKMHTRGHHPHCAVHHDRPISVSSLDRRRRREKLRKEMTIAAREGVAGSRKPFYPPPTCMLQTDLYIPNLSIVRRLSFQACNCRDPIGRSDSRSERSIVRSCHLKSAHTRVIKTNTKCAPARETHYEAAAASSICGGTRQKPGRVMARHFCD